MWTLAVGQALGLRRARSPGFSTIQQDPKDATRGRAQTNASVPSPGHLTVAIIGVQLYRSDRLEPMNTNGKSLESWIWDAACSIRGAKDAPKYKEVILPLIFAKRLSDGLGSCYS
jgi:hypothetical protein